MRSWFSKLMTGYVGVTLWPLGVYLQESNILDESTIRHETTHWLQQREMLGLFFYIWYFAERLIKIPIYGWAGSYYNISFEREAYENESLNTYNQTREHYSWLKYVV